MSESQREHNDVLDILSDALKVMKNVEEPDGTIIEKAVIDPRIAWYKTQNIASNQFGGLGFELEIFRALKEQCFFNMSQPRAIVLSSQLDGPIQAWERSIDAKSSETTRDRHNSLSNLIDKLNKKTSERMYTMKGGLNRSLWSGIIGRDEEKDVEKD